MKSEQSSLLDPAVNFVCYFLHRKANPKKESFRLQNEEAAQIGLVLKASQTLQCHHSIILDMV